MCPLPTESVLFLDSNYYSNLSCILTSCVLRLNSSDQDGEPMYIQMVTALVLQLIQCVVHLPSDKETFEEYDTKVGEQPTTENCHTNQQIYNLYTYKHSDVTFCSRALFLFFRWIKMC